MGLAQVRSATFVPVAQPNQRSRSGPLNQVERLNLEIRHQSLVAEANHEQVMFEDLVRRAQAELKFLATGLGRCLDLVMPLGNDADEMFQASFAQSRLGHRNTQLEIVAA
jgi:hypothetical protein